VSGVERATVGYPGGLAARFRWGGPGTADDVFALSEQGGTLADHGPLAGGDLDRMCRAELRVEGPLGDWTARFASPVFDTPAGVLWDTEAQLVVKYGFGTYALASRSGELRWHHTSGTPVVAVLGSPRLPHVVLQSEVETLTLDPAGSPVWRVAHREVIASAELTGPGLALTDYTGTTSLLDPLTGRALT
jgi:hypothetical protein